MSSAKREYRAPKARDRAPKARDRRRRKTSAASLSPEARGFAKQNRVFEHTRLPLCRPGVSIKKIIIEKRIKHRLFLLITMCYLWAPIVVDIDDVLPINYHIELCCLISIEKEVPVKVKR